MYEDWRKSAGGGIFFEDHSKVKKHKESDD